MPVSTPRADWFGNKVTGWESREEKERSVSKEVLKMQKLPLLNPTANICRELLRINTEDTISFEGKLIGLNCCYPCQRES